MKYYIIAGEASGDLHGGNLIKALHATDPNAQIRCWGGDHMEAAGATVVKHFRDLAFMGFVEVLTHLRTIASNITFCKKDIAAFQPDVVVFIDYPGFNMRIAAWARRQGYKTAYYISPQVWAWKEGRVAALKRDVDKMIVILPFEKTYFAGKQWDVDYVGHPLMEVVKNYRNNVAIVPLSDCPIIALLPGSRAQEIRLKLPIMLQAVRHFPEYAFVVAQAPAQPDSLYQDIIGTAPVQVVRNQTYNLLSQAKAALVTSGTATLETALFGVPEVVCYKGNKISYLLAKQLVKVKYISLVNLIMDKPVVRELIQDDLTEKNIVEALSQLLAESPTLQALRQDYADLANLLGTSRASAAAADIVVALARSKG